MCTFILAWRVLPDAPVVVAATRDERLDRPSRPPRVLDEDPLVVAPQDAEAGGTWLGYNERGLLVAVTNRWTDADLAGERSRGLLVREALGLDSAAAVRAFVAEEVESREYAGFNLVAADADDAFLLAWDGDLAVTAFDPGVHVVVNVGADDDFDVPTFEGAPPDARERFRESAERQTRAVPRARDALEPEAGETAEAWLDRAVGVVRDHDYGFCVHGEGYGTRSSSLVRVPAEGDPVYHFADGKPCESDYERVRL